MSHLGHSCAVAVYLSRTASLSRPESRSADQKTLLLENVKKKPTWSFCLIRRVYTCERLRLWGAEGRRVGRVHGLCPPLRLVGIPGMKRTEAPWSLHWPPPRTVGWGTQA